MCFQLKSVLGRVVSVEISGGKFPEIYSYLSGNFWKFVKEFFHFIRFKYNHMFPSPTVQSDAVK